MAYSVQSDVSNGTLQYIEVRITYFDKAHLSVSIDGIAIPQGNSATEYWWQWDGNRIKMNKAVALNKEVTVRRSTPINIPLHVFRQGATFKDSTVDENFLQQLYINQENFEGRSGTDIYNDMNHHGYRITSLANAIDANDAVPFSQYKADALGATNQRKLAEDARAAALASQNAAKTSETNAASSATSASNSASTAATRASEAVASANTAVANSQTATTKANEAASSAITAQNWANAAANMAVPDDSLGTSKYKNASITTDKIADTSITSAKMADSAVSTAKLADGAVTTAKVPDGAISWAKLSADSRAYIDSINTKIGQVWNGSNLTWGLYINPYHGNDGYHGGRMVFKSANANTANMLVETTSHNGVATLFRAWCEGASNGGNNRGAYLNLSDCREGIGTQICTDSTNQTYARAQRGHIVAYAPNANITLDFGWANNFSIDLNQNFTMHPPANLVAGQSGIIILRQDGAGNRTINWGGKWVGNKGVKPVLSTGAWATDYLMYFVEHADRIYVSIAKEVW